MNKLNICALGSALVVMGGAGTASAQVASTKVGVSLRAGVIFPTDSNVTSGNGTTWFGFGAQYSLLHLDPKSDLKPTVDLSVDYFSRNSFSETPVLLNYVINSNGFFGSVGAGLDFTHVPGNSQTKFGYQVGIGYNLPITEVPIFLEVKYWGAQDSAYNAVGAYIGVRF